MSRCIKLLQIGLASCLIQAPQSFAALVRSDFSLSGQRFALESNATSRVQGTLAVESEEHLLSNPRLSSRQFHLKMFHESGSYGDWDVNPDDTLFRFSLSNGHIWTGLGHPLREAQSQDSDPVPVSSAIGANWVQNQTDALTPKTLGWVGAGAHVQLGGGFYSTLAVSPIFLPTFGPRLSLSESEAPSGSRFTRLPPLYFDLDGKILPMRYRLKTGDISKIILQPQAFVGIGRKDSTSDFGLMAWSAPSPDPDTNPSGKLRVTDDINVIVTAVPKFPRQTFLAARWAGEGLKLSPELQGTYEIRSRELTLSAALRPSENFAFGWLNTFTGKGPQSAAAPETTTTANYAENLAWLEARTMIAGRLEPSLRIERHLAKASGQWLAPRVSYQWNSGLALFLNGSILTGQERSYFGNWRSLDSVSMGAHYRW